MSDLIQPTSKHPEITASRLGLKHAAVQSVQERFTPQWLVVDADMNVHAHSDGAMPFLMRPTALENAMLALPIPVIVDVVRQQWHSSYDFSSDELKPVPPSTKNIVLGEGRELELIVSALEHQEEPDFRLVVIHEFTADVSVKSPVLNTSKERLMAERLQQVDRELNSTRAELQNTVDFTRRVLDSLYVFVGVCDLEGNLIEANQAAIKAADLELEDVLDKPFVDAFWWSHSQESQHKLLGAIEAATRGESSRFDVQIRLVENQIATIDFQMAPMVDDYGNITHLIPSAIDVTERRQVEKALELSEDAMRTLLSEIEEIYAAAPIGLCVLDEELRYVRINDHLAQVNGLSVDDHIGKSVLDVVPDVARNAVDALRQIFETGEPLLDVRLSGETKHKPGVMRHWVESFHPMRTKDGEINRISVVAIEVTDSVHHEAHIEQMRAKAEHANRSKSEFLANMSHEIRTPMTAILGYADLLSTQVQDFDNLQSIETIRRNGLYLIELLDDILDLSKIEANKLDVELTEFSPIAIVEQIGELMQVRADQQALNLSVEYAGKLPVTINNDPTRLRQILVNVVGNAIKFTDKGGVTLSVSYIDHSEPCVKFTVSDTGIGMSGEQLDHIFDAFAQADSTINRRYGGSGLGLTICDRLVKRLGGQLKINSKLGIGTEVTVQLPIGIEKPEIIQAPDTQLAMRSVLNEKSMENVNLACRILAVDDKRDVLSIVERTLKEAGAEVVVATNGQKALDQFASAKAGNASFDILVLDMHMPDIDGFEVVKRLRKAGETIPVIALTADAMKGGRERCMQAGCTDYITKPIDGQLLIRTVHRHLTLQKLNKTASNRDQSRNKQQQTDQRNAASSSVILIVEDHEPSARVLNKLLTRHGYKVVNAASAEQARQFALQCIPDIILSDIVLPGEDGYELVESLRRLPELSKCCIIALSGSNVSEHEKANLFDAFIQKPVDLKALLDVIATHKDHNHTSVTVD